MDPQKFEYVYDARKDIFSSLKLRDDVLVEHASDAYIKACLDYLDKQKVKKLDSLTFRVTDKARTKAFVKKQYHVIEAAGGIVRKDDRILMIYRLKKWDLPKGKIEKGESPREGALREVAEECRVKAALVDEVCHTWHTYSRNHKKYLKKTYWYAMDVLDDSRMQAQREEYIEEVKWLPHEEIKHLLYDSYFSIRYVFREYYRKFSDQRG